MTDLPEIHLLPANAKIPGPATTQPATPVDGQQAPGGPAAGPGSPDYWDFGQANFMPPPMSMDYTAPDPTKVAASKKGSKIALAVVGFVVLCGAGYCGYDILVNDHNPFNTLLAYFDSSPTEKEDSDEKELALPTLKAAPPKPKDLLKVVKGNPYWALPNRLISGEVAAGRQWTPDEEESFRLGLEHHFRYQRYKTVQLIRAQKLAGSDSLLWVALEDKGFWVRMFAAVGLAEFAIELPLKTLEKAISHVEPDLIANFFERFVEKPNAGQIYLMRQAIRLLDERGRLVMLRAIDHSSDELRDLYLVAASLDPGQHIQAWLNQTQRGAHGMEKKKFNELLAIVNGVGSPAQFFTPTSAEARAEHRQERPAENVMSDEELEKQLDQMDQDGNVQLFHEPDAPVETKAADDVPAADTFEYDK